jgi:hypothetical protein
VCGDRFALRAVIKKGFAVFGRRSEIVAAGGTEAVLQRLGDEMAERAVTNEAWDEEFGASPRDRAECSAPAKRDQACNRPKN